MTLQTELADGVLTLRLDRPERLNAIDEPTARALLDALRDAESSAGVRVIVLRGNGRAFCAGRDISEAPTPEILALVQDVSRAIVASPNAGAWSGRWSTTMRSMPRRHASPRVWRASTRRRSGASSGC